MKKLLLLTLLAVLVFAQDKKQANQKKQTGPQPRVVAPSESGRAPSDAVVLFDGGSVSGWTRKDGSPTGCRAEAGEMICATNAGDAVSKETFRDAQIHLEFKVPHMPDQTGQRKGNSGVYVQGCFEVQILDSHDNPTYPDGVLGAVYGFSPPMVNAGRRAGQWQTYDIFYRAPKCDREGRPTEPGNVTVLLNGVLIQENVKLERKGPGCRSGGFCEPGPLLLQDHSGFPNAPHTEMRFRNIWIRRLE